jgi:hypothetical protein
MHATTGSFRRELPGERRLPDAAGARADAAYGCVDWYCYDTPLPPQNSQQLGASSSLGAPREPSLDVKAVLGV